MGQKDEDKVMYVFYENPNKGFTVREISKITKIPRATVHKKLLDLKKRNLVSKDNSSVDSLLFKTKKINYYLEKIVGSGLIDEIVEKLNPSCIILFGSIMKGDSVRESDIDLFVESSVKDKPVELSGFEKKIGHEIQLFVEESVSGMKAKNKNLLSNIINGIKLYGVLDLKW